jgi:hypothetical protein
VTVPRGYAYGVQLEFIQESKEQAVLAQKYGFKEGVKLDSITKKLCNNDVCKVLRPVSWERS